MANPNVFDRLPLLDRDAVVLEKIWDTRVHLLSAKRNTLKEMQIGPSSAPLTKPTLGGKRLLKQRPLHEHPLFD